MSSLSSHPILKQLLWMLLISVAILVIVFVGIKIYSRQGQEFELPDLVGANIDDLRFDKSLNVEFVIVDSVYEQGDPGGRIRNQDPVAHTRVKAGRKVYVSITSYSAEKTAMPDLRDLSVRQAISQLESKGLQCGHLIYVEGSDRNLVISASLNGRLLSPGQEVSRGSKIDLSVSRGDADVMVPFLIGKTPAVAHREIHAASLNVGDEFFDEGSSRVHAVVYRQEPSFNGVSRYPAGTTIMLYYRDASDAEIERMIKEFEIDSSSIIDPIEDDEPWSIEF